MGKWNFKYNFRFITDIKLEFREIKQKTELLLASMQRDMPNDSELEDLVDQFIFIENEEEFDMWLEDLYNWADLERIWLDQI